MIRIEVAEVSVIKELLTVRVSLAGGGGRGSGILSMACICYHICKVHGIKQPFPMSL